LTCEKVKDHELAVGGGVVEKFTVGRVDYFVVAIMVFSDTAKLTDV